MSEASLESKLIAEGIGVFALTFIGAGSIIMGGDLMTVALAHGIVLSIVVTATMNVEKCTKINFWGARPREIACGT